MVKQPHRPCVEQVMVGSSTTHFSTDDLNKFTFQSLETAFGKFILSVDYLPHMSMFRSSDSTPILVVSPSQSHSTASCNCQQQLALVVSPLSPNGYKVSSDSSPSITFSSTSSSSMSELSFALAHHVLESSNSTLSSPLRDLSFSEDDVTSNSFLSKIISPSPNSSSIFTPSPRKDKPSPMTSFSPPRPGTPPPSQQLLARSAPMRVPKRQSSLSKDVTNLADEDYDVLQSKPISMR